MKLLLLILRNVGRNKLRSVLTALAVLFLVVVFSLLTTVLRFLDRTMQQKASDIPVVLTERYRFPSRFDRRHLEQIVYPGSKLNSELSQLPGFRHEKHTLWHFIFFTIDPERKDKNLQFGVIATLPEKIPLMIDELEGLDPKLCELMKKPPRSRLENAGILMGPERLAMIKKKVGDVFRATAISHHEGTGTRQPIEMELEIVGELPGESRWTQSALMDYAYLDRVLHKKESELDGKIMLGWLKFEDQASANQASELIERDIADIKSEIASTAMSRFMDPYKAILNGVKFFLIPAIVLVMALIVANAISITVRERTTETAVLKVLGFRPQQILFLILGEAVLIGAIAGFLGAAMTYVLVNRGGGIKVPMGFFPVFFVPGQVLWWGAALGVATALLGGIIPAWRARTVKVAEVFSKVT
jgi:putative ABC transport system permease protein